MDSTPKKIIAVTGGIGSGKSRVSRFWASFAGVPLINVDQICAELLAKENAGWRAIKEEFDNYFLLPDGSIDRKKMRAVIFSDQKIRLKINSLIHPLAHNKTFEVIDRFNNTVIVDVPLLFEAGWGRHFDRRVVVFADTALCCRRIVTRDAVDPDEAVRTLFSQMPMHDKIMLADHVINNSGSWAATILEIIHLARLISFENKTEEE